MKNEPDIDATASAEIRVTDGELARSVRFNAQDEFPAVYATSRMIALMEVAASRVLAPHLDEGELSVGVAVDVLHTAATAPGALVTATARYTGRDGKLFVFEVVATDNAGEIGRGTHKRAVIDNARLVAGAQKRASSGHAS